MEELPWIWECWSPWILEGVSGMLVGTVMVSGEKFHMFKLEFENWKRNFEIQSQLCFVMKIFQVFCQTLRTCSLINIELIDKILEDSCLSYLKQ